MSNRSNSNTPSSNRSNSNTPSSNQQLRNASQSSPARLPRKPVVPRFPRLPRVPELPMEIYTEIASYLPLSSKPAYRRASKMTNQADVLHLHECTRNPTNSEIARWLLQQQEFMREDIKSRKSQLWNVLDTKGEIRLNFTHNNGKYFSFDTATGDLFIKTGYVIQNDRLEKQLYSFEDIMDVISKRSLDYGFSVDITNWYIIKGVLKNRLSCFNYQITLFEMMKHVLANTFPYRNEPHPGNILWQVDYTRNFVTDNALKRLKLEFSDKFGVPLEILRSASDYKINPILNKIFGTTYNQYYHVTENLFNLNMQDVNAWLHLWIVNLNLDDMEYPRIFNND